MRWFEPLGPPDPTLRAVHAGARATITSRQAPTRRPRVKNRLSLTLSRVGPRAQTAGSAIRCDIPFPLGPCRYPRQRGLRRLGLKVFRITVDSHSGSPLVPEEHVRVGCPSHPHRRCVWRARPGPDIKETGFEEVRVRCRHCCSGGGRRSSGACRTLRHFWHPCGVNVGVRGEVRDSERFLWPVRLRLFGYRPARSPWRHQPFPR